MAKGSREPYSLILPVGKVLPVVSAGDDEVTIEWPGNRVEITVVLSRKAAGDLEQALHDALCCYCNEPEPQP